MKGPGSALVVVVLLALAGAPAWAHIPDGAAGERDPLTFGPPHPLALPAQQPPEPPATPTPRADCRPGSRPEPGMQGRVARADVDAGRVDEGYRCNVAVVSRTGSTGGFRVHRYIDRAGRECAYYDTALLFPTNAFSGSAEPTGVAVLDMSNPARPVRTTTLLTPAMQTPHESLNISIRRGVLAAVLGNPSAYPGGIDVFDISQDCRHPVVKAAAFPASPFGHESGMAPDGLTFFPTSPGRQLAAVDIANPSQPRTLANSGIGTHGMSVSEDGRRGYLAVGDGLGIVDLSDVQDRRPGPQIREISRLTWSNVTIPQIPIPVTIRGRRYVVEVDEYSTTEDGDVTGHGPRVGAARIIDVEDERRPRVVSNIRLEVHQEENRDAIAGDYGARSPVQGYAAHYCNVPRREDPGIMACSMILSGLRVFDIRDPEKPKEIAYFVAPPSTVSASGSPVIDERANWAMSQPAFAPERGEIWYSDGTSGFYALKVDPQVWPFASESRTAGGERCRDTRGLGAVGVRGARGRTDLRFTRRLDLPVRIDVFRVSAGRRVLGERRVAAFTNRSRTVRWRARLPRGVYFARFRMLRGGRAVDTERVVFERRAGTLRARPDHHRRDTCSLLRRFKLERPVFGGTSGAPLSIAYRLTAAADVSVTITCGRKGVRRFAAARRTAGRTYRLTLPSRRLPRGDYRVRLQARSADDQLQAVLTARRL